MIKGISIVILIFGTIFLYVKEVPYFTNTFEINYLLFRALGIGAALGAILGWRQAKNATDSLEKTQWFLICIVGLALAMPPIASFSNHAFASGEKNKLSVQFLNQKALKTNRFGVGRHERAASTPDGGADFVYTTFLLNNESQRVRSNGRLFPQEMAAGTHVELPVQKGFWGFSFVTLD
ncbi:MAG: hypothetical protein RIS64_3168 [Bacteroidota bacterium]|jgi:hypothetical protein